MIRILLFVIISINFSYSQNFHTPENIKLFADYLFCSKDYLRAVLEYEEYIKHYDNDTVLFKIALGYSKIENYSEAVQRFMNISVQSDYYSSARLEYLKSKLFLEDYNSIIDFSKNNLGNNELKLINMSILLSDKNLPERNNFIFAFENNLRTQIEDFYDYKINPPYKSPLLAGIFSTVVPGSGKLYTNQISEGLTSLLLNGLFAFLSYNNFKNDHTTRGWIFAGVGAFFYAGNIYGSAVSANIYNQRVDYEYKENVKSFLETHNYFIERYEFCK
jgi:TM2 domain-containing membrane protein YozV